jgi:hypothetical protein
MIAGGFEVTVVGALLLLAVDSQDKTGLGSSDGRSSGPKIGNSG